MQITQMNQLYMITKYSVFIVFNTKYDFQIKLKVPKCCIEIAKKTK